MPHSFKRNLNGKIEFLQREILLQDPESLHAHRHRRNEVAHDPNATSLDWLELDLAVDKTEAELQHLDLVGSRPHYEFYGESHRAKNTDDPEIAFSIEYCAGIKELDKWVIRLDWVKNVHRSVTA